MIIVIGAMKRMSGKFINNMFMDRIGIIGLGFVGSAIRGSIDEPMSKIVLHDPAKGFTASFLELAECDGIFVCVPTPTCEDGKCDTSILQDVLEDLYHVNYKGVIISKCTAPPHAYEFMNNQYPNLVHNPEFLTAANAQQDYVNGTFAIIGGSVKAYINEAERIIRLGQRNLKNVEHCTIGEAALAKYAINSFLATKVVFMNELEKVASTAGLDFNKITRMIQNDNRIGRSHMQVPGPDGYYGFGGMCFPKDTSALLQYAESLSVNLNVLDSAVKKNTLLRLTKT